MAKAGEESQTVYIVRKEWNSVEKPSRRAENKKLMVMTKNSL